MSKATTKKYSSNFKDKVAIRLQATERINDIRVLDCFHAKGELWNKIREYRNVNDFLGIEKNKKLKSTDRVIYDNNIKVLREINIDNYNIIDLDAYGNPFEQMNIVFERCKKPKIIIYTFISFGISGIPKEINVFKECSLKCKTILNSYLEDMFENYLYKNGVSEYFEIKKNELSMTNKRYGFFYYNPLQKR